METALIEETQITETGTQGVRGREVQVTTDSKEWTKAQEMGRKCAELTGDRAPGEDRAAERHMTQRTCRGTSTNTETTRVNRRE